jgi:hypothetical protein
MNRLTDILGEASEVLKSERVTSQTAEQRDPPFERAIKLLQERHETDGLSREEQADMVRFFVANPTAVSAYLALGDDDLRQIWMGATLRALSGISAASSSGL